MKAETFDIYLKPYIHDDLTSNYPYSHTKNKKEYRNSTPRKKDNAKTVLSGNHF